TRRPGPAETGSAPDAWWRAEWRSPAQSWPPGCSLPSPSPRRLKGLPARGSERWPSARPERLGSGPERLGSAEGVELARHQAEPALLAAAQHDHLDGNVDQVGDH